MRSIETGARTRFIIKSYSISEVDSPLKTTEERTLKKIKLDQIGTLKKHMYNLSYVNKIHNR